MSVTAPCTHRMLGIDQEILGQLVKNVASIADVRTRDIILFSLKCSRHPQNLTAKDYEQLRRHELSQSEVMEIIGMSALAVYANILADATGMEADEMFDR